MKGEKPESWQAQQASLDSVQVWVVNLGRRDDVSNSREPAHICQRALPETGLFFYDDWLLIMNCGETKMDATLKELGMKPLRFGVSRVIDAAIWWARVREANKPLA